MRTCRDVTQLVLQGLDRELTWREQLGLRFHMLICQACPRFQQQMVFMRQAMGRWKKYSESSESDPK
jgi:hypothetical protein